MICNKRSEHGGIELPNVVSVHLFFNCKLYRLAGEFSNFCIPTRLVASLSPWFDLRLLLIPMPSPLPPAHPPASNDMASLPFRTCHRWHVSRSYVDWMKTRRNHRLSFSVSLHGTTESYRRNRHVRKHCNYFGNGSGIYPISGTQNQSVCFATRGTWG